MATFGSLPVTTMRRTTSVLLSLALLSMPAAAQPPQRLFYSGHSLLDEPLTSDVARIAASLGTPLQWSRQYKEGSSIRDRNTQDPQALKGAAHDALIVTEQHRLIDSLLWNDSVAQLRQLHDRLIVGNPRGQTWFFAAWLNVDNADDPRRWIAYEREASPVWQCIVTRINASLAAEGRADRIAFLPAGALLAALVEQATQDRGIAGVSASSPRGTLDRLFRDDVHLTPLGSYFMSLVVYATLFERSPAGASVPEGIDVAAARGLQGVAWELVQRERTLRQSLPPQRCAERTQAFVATYAAYVRDVIDRPRSGAWRAWWLWAKHRVQWHWALRG